MIKEEKKRPAVRFEGFEEDWGQRKLGHIVGRVTRKNKDLVSTLPLTISAQYGLIDQNEFFDKRIASKDVSNYYLIHKGEFAYNKSTSIDAPWGAIKRLDRYDNGVLSTLYIIFRILDEKQVDSDYLASYYNTALWYKSIRMIAAEGARNHGLLNIAPDDFFETTLMIPRDIAEQKKIGAYLKNLDDLITLHRRKLEEMRTLKKYFLQNMFPAEGETVPKIRFKGFTGDWEQRKLKEIVVINGRIGFRGYTSKDIITKEEGGVLTFSPTNIVDNRLNLFSHKTYITKKKYDESPEIKVHNGDILFVKTGSTLGKNALVTDLFEDASINPQMVVIHTPEDIQPFLATALTSNEIQKQVATSRIGGAVPTLTENKIKNFNISIPMRGEEIKLIGNFFIKLDDLITLHQRKVDQLQTLKKFMLQNLFV